ncbi:alpha/beta fold hydrolase [Catellatospora bangladeshensis]|uniref:Alpha/beta hydrolase n=1 Tax=Catellatospora bangladeshensis TaxID=310355 RepID=A0A8J3JHJ5_9ACTN|nr:alpha/beta hydrolase [Catellatospora bangladeshensis]GIF84992.1 alpha/beta hydrolase [Catellatospora bangladeshensis]
MSTRRVLTGVAAVLAVALTFAVAAPAAAAARKQTKPTIVLVHGAFADSSSWNAVIPLLQAQGYPVVAAPNALRGVSSDAAEVAALLKTISGPIVLVGHSYGGSVISNAAEGNPNVKALVYVSAFAPEVGESAASLSGKFPGSTLAQALAPPVALAGGGRDLYIDRAKFRDQFAADVPEALAAQMGAGQRPITEAALNEASPAAAWKNIPSWFVYGTADKNIPPQALAFMAQRAGAKESVAVDGASHVVMVSQPDRVAQVIQNAAATATQ